ncbi:hypothetical protein IWX49DRAFT_196565 [Phyllosticta citricarpa]|uniref:Uncharacterized protein n=2 Tax=Phyllosticta TaxID=121621 RepID=A0ABR1M5P6_9PEZI
MGCSLTARMLMQLASVQKNLARIAHETYQFDSNFKSTSPALGDGQDGPGAMETTPADPTSCPLEQNDGEASRTKDVMHHTLHVHNGNWKLVRPIGLLKSVIPAFAISFNCSMSSVMSTRSFRNSAVSNWSAGIHSPAIFLCNLVKRGPVSRHSEWRNIFLSSHPKARISFPVVELGTCLLITLEVASEATNRFQMKMRPVRKLSPKHTGSWLPAVLRLHTVYTTHLGACSVIEPKERMLL